MLKAVKSALCGEKNYLQILFAILFLTGLQFNSALAGDKIKIHLQQPPPNKLGVSDLWKLELENTSGENLTIYLEGTVTESKDGLIVEGQSKPFVIKPGKTSYSYNDFKNGSVSWKNNKYQEAIVRTGNAPSGSYTICVTAKLESGDVTGQENCIEQKIELTGEQQITLVSPGDGEELDPDTLPGLTFIWRDCPLCPPPVVYTLRIVELKGSQSPDVAMQNNTVFFEQKEIKGTTLQYPLTAPKPEKGKKYAWQIKCGNVNSDVWTFSMLGAQYQVIVDTVIVRCDPLSPVPNCYLYQVKVRNNNPVGSPGPTNTSKASIIQTTPTASSITPALNTLSPGILYLGTYTISGTICFTSPPGTINFVVKMQDNTDPIGYNATTTYSVNVPNCNKNCCENFTRTVTGITVMPTSFPGVYNYSAILTAGPNKIKKVVATLDYMQWISSNENCKKCVNNSQNWGNINSVPSPTIAGFSSVQFTPSGSVSSYSHEVIWSGGSVNMTGGVPVNLYLVFPQQSTLSCCPDTINFCIKFEFTDTTCMTCDTVVCFHYIRNTSTNPLIHIDEMMHLKDMDKELEKEQPIENNEEYKRSKEEQDELMKKNKKDGEGQAMSSVNHRAVTSRKNQTAKGAK